MSNITTYLVSASLILLVIRQIREHPLDARSLATPVLAVGAAAVMFLHAAFGSGRVSAMRHLDSRLRRGSRLADGGEIPGDTAREAMGIGGLSARLWSGRCQRLVQGGGRR